MLIISFDAVGDLEFERLLEYPTFSAFSKQAAVFRDIPAIIISNTYPIHTSVVTGVLPRTHGLTANTEPFPAKHPEWQNSDTRIRVKTLWQVAAEKGIDTAAVFWPVTAYSKSVRYNIPEVLPRPGKNQIVASLRAGSKFLQMKMVLRYGRQLDGISQPKLDGFGAACMADILREQRPGLALMHLTAYDSLCHKYGKGSDHLNIAYEALDRNLSVLLEAAGERDVIIFSDHSQINLHTELMLNDILVKEGLLLRKNGDYSPGESGCFIECCGGSAFFHKGNLPDGHVEEIQTIIEKSEGFRRFLTGEEIRDSGYEGVAFGFCAHAGYCYVATPHGNKADHGYPADMPDYNVFYMARGFGLPPGSVTQGGSLLDIAPMVSRRLDSARH